MKKILTTRLILFGALFINLFWQSNLYSNVTDGIRCNGIENITTFNLSQPDEIRSSTGKVGENHTGKAGSTYLYTRADINNQYDVVVTQLVSSTGEAPNGVFYNPRGDQYYSNNTLNSFFAPAWSFDDTRDKRSYQSEMKFRFQFFLTGTKTPVRLNVIATTLDNDGVNSSAYIVHEQVEYGNAPTSWLENKESTMTRSGNIITGPNKVDNGIVVRPSTTIGAFFSNVTEVVWASRHLINDYSRNSGASSRLSALSFKCEAGYDPDIIPPLTGTVVDPKNPKKVLICHIPPGNPSNIQNISISKNSLRTHITHHDDYDGVCTSPLLEDFSDSPADGETAPNGNSTTRYGQAIHKIITGIQLGDAIDAEEDSISNLNANGDGSDDDGIIIPPLIRGETATITAATLGEAGYLQGWIDWNGDGSFEENEQIATNLRDGNADDTDETTNNIRFNINIPETSTIYPTYARFRWSTTADLDSTTIANNGEVEDYKISIKNSIIASCETGFFQHLQKQGTDSNGQAYKHELGKLDIEAKTYKTKFVYENAELNALGYSITDNVFYGTSTKSDDYALYKVKLNGELKRLLNLPEAIYAGDVDNNNIWYGFKGKNVYKVDLNNSPLTFIKIKTSNNKNLQAVDFVFKKSDGKFYGVKGSSNKNKKIKHSLYIYNPIDNTVLTKELTGDIDTSGNKGTYGASWTDASGSIYVGNNYTGKIHWIDPETGNTVHVITNTSKLSKNDGISCAEAPPPFTFDYGDAPESYGLSPHLIPIEPPTIYLGATPPDAEDITGETYPYTTDDATGDDNQTNDDEDGVADFQNKTLVAGQIYSVDVITHGENGYLNAWIDWNGNGTFENDTIEHVAATIVVSGTTHLNIIVPPSAVSGVTYARFRYSTKEELSPTALANNGEVEDYKVIVEGGSEVCTIDDLPSSIYSTAAVAINLKRLDSSTRVFQTQFDNRAWEGYVLSYDLDLTNNNGNTKSQKWNAADKVQYNNRTVFSYNPQVTTNNKGIIFSWDQLNASQKNALKKAASGSNANKTATGKKRLRWIRGEQTDEKTASNTSGIFRPRDKLLGDIIHSSPVFSGQRENFGYTSLTAAQGGVKYPAFLTAKQSRQAALFVGANDGMLHSFNANTGEELFGFVPNEVMPNLANLSSLQYGCQDEDCIPHQYYVDGTSVVGDVYFDTQWHTVLISTLGKGGKGIFALDVTNPDPNPDPDVSLETFDSNKIMWEISTTQAADNAAVYAEHMGYSTPSASIVRLNNNKWATVISNGPESLSGTAMLFLIDISNGELIKAIDTGVGSADLPNGLSSSIAVDTNNDRTADIIYAGDLQGNMWKFNLSSTDADDWGVAYKDGNTPKPLFTTCERADEIPCSKHQVITAKPEVGHHPLGGYMIYFGTGQYFDVADNVMSASPDINSLYGIWDNGEPITTLTNLVKHTILQESIIPDTNNDLKARITSTDPVDFTQKKGWYIPLLAPNTTREGERIIAKSLLREKRLIITTLIPPKNNCSLGGGSWITELNALDGNPLEFPPIDINDDQQFTDADKVNYQGKLTVISAIQKISLGMILSTPEIITHTSLSEGKYINGTNGAIGMFRESASRAIGRQSWRRLR